MSLLDTSCVTAVTGYDSVINQPERAVALYMVLLDFPSGRTQSNIALRSENAGTARDYVSLRAEEWDEKPTRIRLRRISEETAAALVRNGAVDWAGV